MGTWRAKASEFLQRWRLARDEVKRAKGDRRDQRRAEELDMAREGLSRRPGGDAG